MVWPHGLYSIKKDDEVASPSEISPTTPRQWSFIKEAYVSFRRL